jgi:hypothetical protein
MFEPALPALPVDQHVLRRLRDKTDDVIAAMRMAIFADYNEEPAPIAGRDVLTTAFPDLDEYLSPLDLKAANDAWDANGILMEFQEMQLTAVKNLRKRIDHRLNLMARMETRANNRELEMTAEYRQTAARSNDHPKKQKRAAGPGEAEVVIRAFFVAHHKYNNGKCANYEPITASELAQKTRTARGNFTRFLNKMFMGNSTTKGGCSRYRQACRDEKKLDRSMKMIAGDLTPHILWNPLSNHVGSDKDDPKNRDMRDDH